MAKFCSIKDRAHVFINFSFISNRRIRETTDKVSGACRIRIMPILINTFICTIIVMASSVRARRLRAILLVSDSPDHW